MLSVLLALLSVAPALAAETPLSPDPDVALLQSYGIVIGDGTGDLKLDSTITRAELATIAVRAMGSEELSTYFEDSTLYSDMIGRFAWANRYAAMASSLGVMQGRGNGIFDPGSDITNAEVFTVILRLVEKEPQGAWNPELVMSVASQLGIAEGQTDLTANLPAYRGAIFKALAKAMTTIQLADGTTALYKYIDKAPPVLTVDPVPTTASASVTVTGTANGATSVTVNGQAATFNGSRFTASVSLTAGATAVAVVAKDAAGNTATQNITITRSSNAAKIEVTGAASVKPGDTVTVKATAYDSANRALPADAVTAKLSNSLATYDAATGAFKAGNTAGKVTITFTSGSVTKSVDVIIAGLSADAEGVRIRSINTGNTLTVKKSTTITVEVVDQDGDFILADNGRSVTLDVDDLDDVTITPVTALTVAGIATFTVKGDTEGESTMTATSAGLDSDELDVYFGSGTRVVLTADPNSANADGYTEVEIRATLKDDDGNTVTNNSGSDIEITLDIPTNREATVTSSYITIPKGRNNSSGYDGELTAGSEPESVKVTGEITSTHNYSVVPVTVSFGKVSTGNAATLDIVGGSGSYDADVDGDGDTARLTVRAVDSKGSLIVNQSYAFQVDVTTTNDEPLMDGVPSGVTLLIDNETPVKGAANAVIARTERGIADLTLTYNKSGKVTVKVVGVDPDDEDAMDDEGEWAEALSGRSLKSGEQTVRFTSTAVGLQAKVDLASSTKVANQIDYGVLNANGSSSATIKVYAVDANGGWVSSFTGNVTLTGGEGVTTLPGHETVRASGGVAEFVVKSVKDKVGIDTWTATSGTWTDEIQVATADTKAATPVVWNMHGNTGGEGRVGAGDSELVIDIEPQDEYGYVKVLRGNSVIYTSDVLDLSNQPQVRVPKSLLTSSTSSSTSYSIKVNNGFADSDASSPPWTITNETPVKTNITKVRFKADETDVVAGKFHTITVTATGLSSGGKINPALVFLRGAGDASTKTTLLELGVNEADCTMSSSSFTCKIPKENLSEVPVFTGKVVLDTEAGFYVSGGKAAERDTDISDNYVTPMARITAAAIELTRAANGTVTGASLILTGVDLNQGTVYPAKLKLGGITLAGQKSTYTTSSGNRLTIPLSSASATAVGGLDSDVTLEAAAGWLKSSSDANLPVSVDGVTAANPLTSQKFTWNAGTTPTVTLTLKGGNLRNGTFTPSLLKITDSSTFEVPLSGYLTETTVGDNDTVTITIDGTDAANLHAKKGRSLYLVGTATATTSWFETENGWLVEAMPRPSKSIGWSN